MSMLRKVISYFFKRQAVDNTDVVSAEGQATRFNFEVTPGQVGDVIRAVSQQKKIKYNAKLQYRKKKSQNKNWAKWRV